MPVDLSGGRFIEYPMQCLNYPMQCFQHKNSKEAYKMTTFGSYHRMDTVFFGLRRTFLFMTPVRVIGRGLVGRSNMNDCCLVDKLTAGGSILVRV